MLLNIAQEPKKRVLCSKTGNICLLITLKTQREIFI